MATPEDTVRGYLAAFQSGDFDAAYPLVTAAMAQQQSRAEWVAEQQWVARVAEVRILAFEVFPARAEGDTARVPARLRSLNALVSRLAVEEHELYTLRREAGRWKVDRQDIVEGDAVARWFPAPAAAAADPTAAPMP